MNAIKIDVTQELGELLCHVSQIACLIRMKVSPKGSEIDADIHWLADSLHQYNYLGEALIEGNISQLYSAAKSLKNHTAWFNDPKSKDRALEFSPNSVFTKHEGEQDLGKIIGLLNTISEKAFNCLNDLQPIPAATDSVEKSRSEAALLAKFYEALSALPEPLFQRIKAELADG